MLYNIFKWNLFSNIFPLENSDTKHEFIGTPPQIGTNTNNSKHSYQHGKNFRYVTAMASF